MILGKLRDYKYSDSISKLNGFYNKDWNTEEVKKFQLQKFNRVWSEILVDSSLQNYYGKRELPQKFSSWDEFKHKIPTMKRKDVQEISKSIKKKSNYDLIRTTGGSTSEPLQIPVTRSELKVQDKDIWFSRNHLNIQPSNRLFMIWGHSHLLGSGLSGKINKVKRKVKDYFLGYYRFSAYNINDKNLIKAGDEMLRFKPDYIISYSVALERFARVNSYRKELFNKLDLKAAIATAESFPSDESSESIRDTLGCPVVMEYGAVETGILAFQKNPDYFNVLWHNYYLEAEESKDFPGNYELLVTTLYKRALPLIRYKIGDMVTYDPKDKGLPLSFKNIFGRCNDYIELDDGSYIHSEAFSHALKDFSEIISFQVKQHTPKDFELNYLSAEGLNETQRDEIKRRLKLIDQVLGSIKINKVDTLSQTISGKTKSIERAIHV